MINTDSKLISIVVVVLIFIAFVGSMLASHVLLTVSDVETISTVPTNISLSGNDARSIVSVSNGTVTLDSSNYTFYEDADILQIDDMSFVSGGLDLTVTYLDASESYVENSSTRTLLAVLFILVVIGIILFVLGKNTSR